MAPSTVSALFLKNLFLPLVAALCDVTMLEVEAAERRWVEAVATDIELGWFPPLLNIWRLSNVEVLKSDTSEDMRLV